jgi:hypothetical protein
MRCLRIYATPDGESHFDEIDIPTTRRPVFPDTAPFELSAQYPGVTYPLYSHPRGHARSLLPYRAGAGAHGEARRRCGVRDERLERYGMFGPAALSWWRTRTEGGTSPAIPQRSRPLSGLRCQTASICHPGKSLALSGGPEGDLAAVSTWVGLRSVVLFCRHVRSWAPCQSHLGHTPLHDPKPRQNCLSVVNDSSIRIPVLK